MPKSPILGGFSRTRSQNAADSLAVNLATEVIETKEGKVPAYLFLTSGLDLVTTIGSGPIRGALTLNGIAYIVSGPQVWSLTPNGVATLCGSIGNVPTPVSMLQNTKQLLIIDGVGAWLVPGGYPMTGGTIASTVGIPETGGLYAVNDQIALLASSGNQSSFPVIQVEAVANNPVTGALLPNAGTTYNTASNVATTPIEPQPGNGSGLVVDILSVTNGVITGTDLNTGGAGYAVGDTGQIGTGGVAGAGNAIYQVTSQSGGVVTGFRLLSGGTSYVVQSAVTTLATAGIAANIGQGLTFNITASAGPITAYTIADGGTGFIYGAAGTISGGTGDATFYVTAVGPVGAVTAFTIIQGGSVDTQPTSFTQKSTTGSGSGLVLSSLTFGAFVGLVPITMPFPNPTMGDISDGFGLCVFRGSQFIAQSDELDLSTWQPLNFGTSDQSPDNCVSLKVIHDEAFILKESNTEVWVDAATANFAFEPIISVHIEFGIAAPFSVAIADEDLIWLSRNDQGQGIIVSATGYRTKPISTQALVNEFQKYATIGDAQAYVRQEGEHVYYVLTFPTANKTWVYDKTTSGFLATPIWHQLAAFENGSFNRHWGNAWLPPWNNNMTAQGASPGLIGDYRNGNLYAFNPNTLTDNGAPRKWLRRWRALPATTFAAVKYSFLAIKMQTGIGVSGGTAAMDVPIYLRDGFGNLILDGFGKPIIIGYTFGALPTPQVVLRWSDDDGYSWSNERIVAAGQLGQTAMTVKFNRLGMTGRFSGSDRLFELSSSDPFITALIDAEVDAA